MSEYLREIRTSGDGDYIEIWMTPPPQLGISFEVIRQEWNADCTERIIHEIRIVA